MNMMRWLPLLYLFLAGALHSAPARAQSTTERCPLLPAGSGLSWTRLDGADFAFCKALRDSDGGEVFAVMLAAKSPFKPARSNRAEEYSIDGHQGYWYRSQIAATPAAQVREALIELGDGRVAHISVRAPAPELLPELMRQAEALRFQGARPRNP